MYTRKKPSVIYKKKLVSSGNYEILKLGENLFDRYGIHNLYVTENVADILLKALEHTFEEEIENIFMKDSNDSLDNIEYKCSSFNVYLEVLQAKQFSYSYDLDDLHRMILYDEFLVFGNEMAHIYDSDYIKKAIQYFDKAGYELPMKMFYRRNINFIKNRKIFRVMLANDIRNLSLIEQIVLYEAYRLFEDYSVVMPYLWVTGVLNEYELGEAYSDSFYRIDDHLERRCVLDNMGEEIMKMDKDKMIRELHFLKQLMKAYKKDAFINSLN